MTCKQPSQDCTLLEIFSVSCALAHQLYLQGHPLKTHSTQAVCVTYLLDHYSYVAESCAGYDNLIMKQATRTRHENDTFSVKLIVAEDERCFLALNPSRPESLTLLSPDASLYIALKPEVTKSEANDLVLKLNAACEKLVFVIDQAHPLFPAAGNPFEFTH